MRRIRRCHFRRIGILRRRDLLRLFHKQRLLRRGKHRPVFRSLRVDRLRQGAISALRRQKHLRPFIRLRRGQLQALLLRGRKNLRAILRRVRGNIRKHKRCRKKTGRISLPQAFSHRSAPFKT